MKIWQIKQYTPVNRQDADEINRCAAFAADRIGWPPTGYTYYEIIVPPDQIPKDGYTILGPHRMPIARIFYSDYKFILSNAQTESRCYIPEGGLIFAINNALMVRNGVLHIATSPPD